MRYAIGIDTGGTTIKAAIVDENGLVCDTHSVPTPADPDRLIDAAEAIVNTFIERLNAGDVRAGDTTLTLSDVVETVGFDVPGIVDDVNGIAEFSANLGWRDFPARDRLSERIGRPVAFGHDVRTGALAESHWGSGYKDFFFIAIGTGIATVLVLDGTPISTGGWIGELGQIPTPGDDGEIVALEQVCGAAAIARRAHARGIVPENAGAEEVYALYDAGNPEAADVIHSAINALTDALAPIVAAVGPIPIVLGGGLANRGQDLIDQVHAELDAALGIIPTPDIEVAQLGSWAQAQGAALRALMNEDHSEGHCL
ncbi:MAG: ROK family protein [Actinomycetaceae bacterium]|nr:ROK family protein [Actinomycetaceae bacterium]